MRAGRASQTAVMVCKARAFATLTRPGHGFDDATALALLTSEERAEVEHLVAHPSRSWQYVSLVKRGAMMLVRTVAIDNAVRAAAAPQVVILGAGLDGRAWRMDELADAVVFEVDHPDSQRDKRARVGALPQQARDVRFVAVDFAVDDLEPALAAAGHDVTRPTLWIWEGVVMYLARADIERTLAVVERRSAPRSRITILYHRASWILPLVGLFLRSVGEPLRSRFTPAQMSALLARFHFRSTEDNDIPTLAARMSPDLGADTTAMAHLRIVVAERAAMPG